MIGNVIKSKIERPQIGSKLVSRPRLTEFLSQERAGGVTLVTAPAGYGKTTLVASWLQSISQPAAWLSLKEEDNDPISFCSHIIAALRGAIPGFGRAINTLMRPPSPPIEAAMTQIVNELAPRKRKLTLVLDDYDAISNAAIHQAITFLIERQPQNLHLVVISRSDPAFMLSRLRSQARLLRLSNEDLRFTIDEAQAFFSHTMNVPLPRPKIESLLSQTEGWVAGLQLAALSLRHNTNNEFSVDGFSDHHGEITQFVIREVLSHLPREILSFLSRTAILERLSAPLCDAVTGRNDGEEMLNELEHRHLFLVPLAHDRSWFRYHHLFAEALRVTLIKTVPAETVRELHAKAAIWLSRRRLITEALRHAKQAQDVELIASILDSYGSEWLTEGHIAAFVTWLREIPKPIILKYPSLCWLYAFVIYLGDGPDPVAVEPYLTAAERFFADTHHRLTPVTDRNVPGRLALLRGYQARYAGRIPQAIELFNVAAASIPTDDMLYSSAKLNLAICHLVTNKFSAARVILAPYAEINESQTNYWVSATSFMGLARIKLAQGKLKAATEICQYGLDQFRARGLNKLPVCSVLLMQLGEIAYLQNRLEESQNLLEQAIALSSGGGLRFFDSCSHALLARTRTARGLTEQLVWGQEEELTFLRTWSQAQNVVPPLGALIARLWLSQGRYDDVAEWLDARDIRQEKEPVPEQEAEYIVLARLLFSQRRHGDAVRLLEYLLHSAEHDKRHGASIEILILLALGHQSGGDSKAATVALHHAIKLADKEQHIRPFLDEGEPMRMLLKKALLQGENTDCIRRLLDAAAPREPALESGLAVPLSRKEEQVASYLITGLSNEEIANRMFLSLNTVKMHLKNLYRKLDVTKRYDAIQKIREARPSE